MSPLFTSIKHVFVRVGTLFYRQEKAKSKWDKAVDGYSRLPRPIMVTMIIAMFFWSVWWSGGDFEKWARAMQLIPSDLWALIMVIVGVLWGAKKLSGDIGNGFGREYRQHDYEAEKELENPIKPGDNPIVDQWRNRTK